MFKHITKRNGQIVEFDSTKIISAILKAGEATGEFGEKQARSLTLRVLTLARDTISELTPNVEEIQDIVEHVLLNSYYHKTAKAYIIYREQHNQLRKIAVDANVDLMDSYIGGHDWRIKENSNMSYSLQGLNNHISSDITTTYWLNKIYPPSVRDVHINGDLHIHDLSLLSVYCVGWDLQDLLVEGFRGVSGKVESSPPKHLRTALGQIVNFFYTLQGEAAGAQAMSNFDTLLAPFVRYDNLDYDDVKQAMQEFVFNTNIPTRVGFQTPFTNITMDLVVPSTLKDIAVVIGGESQKETYSEFQDEMDVINAAFAEVMMEGDSKGRVFTFPIPTYNITEDFDWFNPKLDNIWKMTGKYGIPYFSNFVNSDMSPDDARSMCPLPGYTKVVVRRKNGENRMGQEPDSVQVRTMESVIQSMKQYPHIQWQSFYNGEWSDIKNAQHHYDCMKVFSMKNGTTIEMGMKHLQPVLRGTSVVNVQAKDVLPTDMLPFNRTVDGTMYIGISKIDETVSPQDLYCFEVDNDTHLFTLANGLITHNCRLRLDNRELRKRGGGLFGANPLTGSIGVVTINLPRIGYLATNEEDYVNRLDKLINLAVESLCIKRKMLERFTENDLYPYSKFYLRNIKKRNGSYWTNHFSTIGILGMNESCINFLGENIASDTGQAFAIRIMDHIRGRMEKIQKDTGEIFNLEATPGEGTTYRFAKNDKSKYKDIICANEAEYLDGAAPFYTNSTHLPVNYTDDMFEALELQDDLQTKYTGGTVQHLFLGEEVDDIETVKRLVSLISYGFRLPYFTLTPTFSICPSHGYIAGEHYECPECGEETEVYSRVVGYLRPIKQWNDSKKTEYHMRKVYDFKKV